MENQRSLKLLAAALALLACCGADSVSAQTVSFTGRVADNAGQPIPGVAVVALGNQTGARVAVSDAQGNYSLSLGSNTDIFLRAYKSSFVFSPLSSEFLSPSGFPLFGSFTRDLTGTQLPFPILILPLPPILLTEDNSLNALALDDVLHTRDPFSVVNDGYFGSDKRTRLTLLLVDMDLYSGETLAIITVQAKDAQQTTYPMIVEDLRKVPAVPWLSQLTVRLPGELAGVTSITVTVSARGQISNSAKVRLK